MLVSKQTWPVFKSIFNISRASVHRLLEGIQDTRNALAHFRSEITAQQIEQLRYCAEWLNHRWEDYQKLQDAKFATQLVQPYPRDNQLPVGVREVHLEYQAREQPKAVKGVTESVFAEEISLLAEETQPRDSRYAPLIDWLNSQPGTMDRVKITFEEIEEIIGRDLPSSAYNHRVWWANDSQGHPHSQLWLEAGWRSTAVNMTEKRLIFARILDRERAYIDFFSKLLVELREHVNFPLKETAPGGRNWLICQTLIESGKSFAHFAFSFTRGRRFRVELYIDTGEKETTKKIFDRMSAGRAVLTIVLGNVAWERIDDKKASRIALYHPGAITDSEDDLEDLRRWAVEKMVWFYNEIEPVASQVAIEVLSA